jgi:outer membrane protein with beta-barrel domain
MRRALKTFLLVGVALMCVPTPARADGYVAPFLGVNFNNPSGNGRANYGVDFGWMSRGIAGLEGDVGYAPNFFGSPGGFGDNHVLTAMGNLIVGVPIGSTHTPAARPYFTIGAGVVQTRVDGTVGPGGVQKVDTNNVGMNVGGGLMGYFSHHVGLRGDVRYIINFSDNNNTVQFGQFHFWRGSIGIVLRP